MCILFIELSWNISYNYFSYYRTSQGPRNESQNEISKDVNWPCTIVAALERTSKALSTADISSFLRSFCPFELPPLFLSSSSFASIVLLSRTTLTRSSRTLRAVRGFSIFPSLVVVFMARICRPCPVCVSTSQNQALCIGTKVEL